MEKHDAATSLRAAVYSPARLLAIHSGVLAAFSLVLSVVSYLLGNVSSQGGLGAMDLHTALTTAQVLLRIVQMVLTPLWAAGLAYAAIGISRRRETLPRDLTEGFRRFRPMLTSTVLIGMQYVFRAFISSFITSSLVMFTPAATAIYDATAKMDSTGQTDLAVLLGEDYLPVMLTIGVLFVLVFLAVSIPVFYRYRMVRYLIVDRQEPGALRAMLRSQMLMFRRKWELAKLDLGFWWYYLLLALGAVVAFGDWILQAAGVTLPFSDTTAYWIFLCSGLLIQLIVKILAGPKVAVTYALRYERYLNEAPPEPTAPVEKQVDPKDLPWTY